MGPALQQPSTVVTRGLDPGSQTSCPSSGAELPQPYAYEQTLWPWILFRGDYRPCSTQAPQSAQRLVIARLLVVGSYETPLSFLGYECSEYCHATVDWHAKVRCI